MTVVALAALPLNAQQAVSGRVLETGTGRALSGARVTIDNATADTTLADGSYRIAFPTGRTSVMVRVTKIGFAPLTRKVELPRNPTIADFELTPRALGLNAIVVTGSAGATQVKKVGHSVAEIRTTSMAEPVASVDNLLVARVPGLTVIPGTGMAGGGSKIRLRGSSSVALSNQPLVYVDGVRIRSDAYPKNSPFDDSGRGPNDTPSPLDDINPADIERVEIVRGPAATTLYGTEAAAGVIQIFTKRGIPGRTSWSSEIDGGLSEVRPFGTSAEPYLRLEPWLRRATRGGVSVSVGGGSDVRYHLSTALQRNEGVLPNDLERKIMVRGNFDLTPARTLSLAVSTGVSADQLHNTPSGPNSQGLTQNAYRGPANSTGIDTKESLDRLLLWDIATNLTHAIGGVTAVWTPGESMSHTVTLGYDRAQSDMQSLRPYGFVFAPQGIIATTRWLATTTTADYLGRFHFGIGRTNAATVAWGAQSIGTDVSSVAAVGQGFAGDSPPTLSSAATTQAAETRTSAVVAGLFSQATLELRDRLFLTAGLRVDGSSSFGHDFGLQPFPRLSASYVVSDESYWPKQLGTFRLRAAYGQAGRAPRVFDADRTWIQSGYNGNPAYLPSSVGNSKLGPERSAEKEIGFDATGMNDRLRAQVTFYRRDTRDALLPVQQPPSLGFLNPQLENVGSIRTQGLETSLDGTIGRDGGISADLGVDVSLNRSRTTGLGGAPSFIVADVAWIRKGYAAPVLIGTFVRNANAIADPVIETNHIFGPNNPTRVIGAHTDLHLWGNTRVGARVEYQGGNYLFDNASESLFRQAAHPLCKSADANNAAGHPELLTAFERVYCKISTVPADGMIVRGDFVKLRNLSVTVLLPRSLMRARDATVTLALRNFLIWKNPELRVFDPEMSGRDGIDAPTRSIEFGVPAPAAMTLAIKVNY
jgi:outer membrane receptor protein involved in Fe transport